MAVNPYLPSYCRRAPQYGGTLLNDRKCSDKFPTITYRGYSNKAGGAVNSGDNSTCPSGTNWVNPVLFTPGMVQNHLTFDNGDGRLS